MKKESKQSKQKSENKTISTELLESYRKALYKVKNFFDSIEDLGVEDVSLTESILKLGEKLGKNIETLAILEKKVASEEAVNSKVRGGAKLSLLEQGDIDND